IWQTNRGCSRTRPSFLAAVARGKRSSSLFDGKRLSRGAKPEPSPAVKLRSACLTGRVSCWQARNRFQVSRDSLDNDDSYGADDRRRRLARSSEFPRPPPLAILGTPRPCRELRPPLG